MEEREQYEENEGKLAAAGRVVKSILVIFVFVLAGLLAFRFWLNSYYPKEMRNLIPTEPLRAAYAAGELRVQTQEIRVLYENPNEGLFFADHMLFSEETGSLQVTVRWNKSTLNKLAERYPETFNPEAESPFTYRLFAGHDRGSEEIISGEGAVIRGESYFPVATEQDSFALYCYERIAFEGVELAGVPWVRIEIYRRGEPLPEGIITVYENHEEYSVFEEYEVKESELS